MKITFNGNTYPIRKNAEGLYSLTDIEKAWLAEGNTGGQLDNWKRAPEVTELIELREFHVFQKRGGNRTPDRGTWGCKEAVIEYASYCSSEFRRAVRKAFIALTEGDTLKAAAIAESVAVSPELVAKVKHARKVMQDVISTSQHIQYLKPNPFTHFATLVVKAATGYTPTQLTGKTTPTLDYIVSHGHGACLSALIACMERVIIDLKRGMGYHDIALSLNVETVRNKDELKELRGLLDIAA